jgi:hypothetical protein
VPSGFDLNNNGVIGGPDDALGFGFFPGQFGMAVYSMHPIDATHARTFQTFLWKDMPGARLPDDPNTAAPADWYSRAELNIFRLSSKSHWDLPILVGGKTVHFLVSHPTPPVFDGPEDRNGTRNFDEIRFWADYITPERSGYIYDDADTFGGLKPGELFVIAGAQNSDPLDGDSIPGAIQQLIEHPLVNTKFTPSSPGAVQQSALQGGANLTHRSDPQFDTADFADTAPGNLRADYVLPRKSLRIVDGAVFWPLNTDRAPSPSASFRSRAPTTGSCGSTSPCRASGNPRIGGGPLPQRAPAPATRGIAEDFLGERRFARRLSGDYRPCPELPAPRAGCARNGSVASSENGAMSARSGRRFVVGRTPIAAL